MNELERLRAAFVDGGKEAIERDPELSALLAASPEFQRVLAMMDEVDRGLADLDAVRMPPALLDRVLEVSVKPRGFWAWLQVRDYALGVAAVLLMLLPWATIWMLSHNRGVEMQVLELQPSIVRLDMQAIEERSLPRTPNGGALATVADAPQVALALEPATPRYIEKIAGGFSGKRWPNVNASALLNAFPYAAAEKDIELRVEVGETPWSRETRLVRIYVTAAKDAVAREAALTVSFNEERVMAYRRIAESGTGGGTSDTLPAGGQFTALFEIVPLQRIGATLREDSVYASMRFVDPKGERRVLQGEGVDRNKSFEAMSIDYRFAAAAAWFALEAKGGPKSDGLAHRLQRMMNVATRALGSEHRAERLALVALARAASDQAHK
ncbi:MAG: DUF3520 domain-containing protein [Deltaproteobacteria bacterium]|nr:DUF3520 domain-containing protein [Deltaproteobacteria bacterium]